MTASDWTTTWIERPGLFDDGVDWMAASDWTTVVDQTITLIGRRASIGRTRRFDEHVGSTMSVRVYTGRMPRV